MDGLGDLSEYRERIEKISEQTGLPVLGEKRVGLSGLLAVIREALDRRRDGRPGQ